ncbi:MAG: glycosyltransferase [Desulfobacter postgatei]|uniref:nucleotide disphospho-sugar-binding domain-containing protein n=1 Tax=Desulfobacter postgatei TaxID=2293 RepID=UPI0023F03A46|nr:glycosyltransferase [Desulfobacter postgatei]MDD4272883.1 glycosyltransferase [Desulfobacter postgatei]
MEKTILVLPYTPTLSHISRPLEIAKQLERNDLQILFAGYKTQKSKIAFIENEGFPCIPLFEPNPDILFNNIRQGNLNFVDNNTLSKMIDEDIRLFKQLNPDLVLTDGRFSAMISTQICDIPHAAIVNASSTEYRSVPYIPMFRYPFLKSGFTKNINSLLDKINLKLEMAVFDTGMNSFNRISKRLKLPVKVTATNCLAGKDITLLADIPEYFPIANQPKSYHYIGPITWKSTGFTLPPKWWPVDKNRSGNIYITMGTTGEEKLFSEIYRLFKASEFTAIVTTGSQAGSFKTVPGKIYVEDYLDGEMVLDASDVVVCHGGNGTIYQALSMGKPVIGIPTIPDQTFNMRRVEALGVGISIPMKKALKNPYIILQKVRYLIEHMDKFATNIKKIRKRIKQFSGADMGAEIIQAYLTS